MTIHLLPPWHPPEVLAGFQLVLSVCHCSFCTFLPLTLLTSTSGWDADPDETRVKKLSKMLEDERG